MTKIEHKVTDHPLEEIFNLPENSTEVTIIKNETPTLKPTEYDEKDEEIDKQFQNVYDNATTAFDELRLQAATSEGKYKGRLEEVAAQYLNTALAAAKEKATFKNFKDKLKQGPGNGFVPFANNQNLFSVDRNDLLDEIIKDRNAIPHETPNKN